MKTNVSQKIGVVVLSIALSVGLVACNSATNKKDNSGSETVKPLVKKVIEEKVKEIIYPIPTSYELASMLNRIGADYILTLSNSVENVDKYFTEKDRALNLGVYGADLSYASTYKRKQEIMLYLKASKKLIDELEISGAYSESLVEDVEKNLDDKDALVKIVTNSFYKTYEYLNSNGKGNLSLLVVSGSFIEGLYIATNISDNTFENPEIVDVIFKQKSSLDKLVAELEGQSADANVADVLASLKKLKVSYDKIEDGSMNIAQFNEIKKNIVALRAEMIN